MTPVTVLIRFIQNKFAPPDSLTVHFRLEGISTAKSKQILLDPDFRLLDVCYIADYRATEPLKLLYSFVQFDPSLRDPPKRLNPMAVDPAPRVVKSDSDKAHRSISSNGNSIPYFTKVRHYQLLFESRLRSILRTAVCACAVKAPLWGAGILRGCL